MKIILEAEVMDKEGPRHTPSMYMPGCAKIRLTVSIGYDGAAQKFNQEVILRLDEVQSIFDHLMKGLTRNMREILVSYLDDRSFLEKFPLTPVLTFQRMR
jgi:hypothetical protein